MRRMTSEAETVPKYEEMFAHRFTTADKEYQEVLKSPPDPPPIVEDWRIRTGGNRRSRDFQPYRRQDDSRNWSNERQWRGRVHGYSHSSVQHQGPYESYSQGSNSHWQSNHHRY
ncbi:RNA guanine-N7 methyltransferase activating subunit-like isoform X1 [Rhincodon typus]|uniref:RNA guanine-N7 methyltransferase activating subunit-like isoform X1 n=1 Tax=Rhincodon typus TaxID=259920 RepID=UPI0009A3B7F5|nr:RNA guanine-N7 methyltransferase activating subunit-like isoform X1 [Rhincodon typus]